MTRRGRIVVAILCCLLTFTTWASAAESQVPALVAELGFAGLHQSSYDRVLWALRPPATASRFKCPSP
jgi:hypothetical protein